MTCRSSCHTRINIPCFQNAFFIILMHLCFFCHNKTCSNLDTLCSEHKCRCNSSSICNSSGCDHRDFNCIYNLRNENHRCILTDVSACFCSFCHQSICSTTLHSLRHRYRSNYRDHFDSGFLPHLYIFFWRSCTCRDNCDTFFDSHLCNFICIRTDHHNIDSKRLICQLLCLTDLFSDPLGRCTCCSDQSKSTGI